MSFPAVDEVTLPLVEAWHQALDTLPTAARDLLTELAIDTPPSLAAHFYAVLMQDSRATRFLDHDQVRNRLQPALARWLTQILCAESNQITDLIQTQTRIGEIHARVGIPVDLVLRGMRAIKLELSHAILQRAGSGQTAFQAINCLTTSVDIAQEGMTVAYAHSNERSTRADAAYRLFSLMQNISAERERQRAMLLDWENQLLYALASPQGLASVTALSKSEFGLWFLHKGIPSFGHSSETAHVTALVHQVDARLQDPASNAAGNPLAILQDIRTDLDQIRELQRMLFERISQMDSGSDTLTNLLNRRFLPTVLRREIELANNNASPFAVLLIDLDHFKAINDQHGHKTGDRALQHVASILSQKTRGSDYLFRHGGEEFLVIMVSVNEVQAQVIADSLRKHIASTPLPMDDGSLLPLSASIGLAMFDGHPDYEQLMHRADAAMYQAKREGRNRVVLATS